jgi:hypothetical protein
MIACLRQGEGDAELQTRYMNQIELNHEFLKKCDPS